MEDKIIDKLNEIARAENVTILFACESGSRGWGFPSVDSDYDVRFIFVRNMEDYSSVFLPDMDLKFPINGELDVSGWDIKKVLTLLFKSNATPFEWIQSPIVYHEEKGFKISFLEQIENFFCARRQVHHYLGTVRSKMMDLDRKTIRLKSLFYILRSLLAAEWSIVHNSYAPMAFEDLAVLLPDNIKDEIKALLSLKSRVDERFEYRLSSDIKSYIGEQFPYLVREAKLLPITQFEKQKLEEYLKFTLYSHDYQRTP
ncbi:nucleotidyltransferase domain-containing protein [Sphingobacterium olei]|uniref:Nucleotidyltransferase domain-containing protein n=1 Tax=Sphingobacterium olei TaxID=2571155 RepID=A0A4U0NDF2_9SPHI|nr:nucleotidyltransferase domain-containing protein [Sphingobacterium olei]TJZ51823.1 nucleotidyltransferase domain-containing protein [Sphingobacterium olei]